MAALERPLAGRVAFVSGAGRNIGRAIACAFARDGADVAIGWNTTEGAAEETRTLVERYGVRAICVRADLGVDAEVQRALDEVGGTLGPIDIAVNNAAIRPHASLADISADDWDRVLSVNVRSSFTIAKAVVPAMREQGSGRILILGGLHGYIGQAHGVHVGASKLALVGFSRALALELGGTGITVNVVVPGTIDTVRDQHSPLLTDTARRLAAIPVGRLGQPGDVAEMCAFLASDRASYITGQELFVTGGTFPLVSH
jgi:3-oxoacyl-[acyl-carrier protein] reductase